MSAAAGSGHQASLSAQAGGGDGMGVWALRLPRARFTLVLPSSGNKERGWNDPPQFSYGLQTQAGGLKRSPLTKRVAAPQDGSPRGAWGPWAQRPAENGQCQG